ncbi:TonB-dependent receptor [Aquincola tertiaricarbonis]|uniref:TonB-dependent receptor n=1 Tax=Aquincola tertiaricarbonis TaxID=391953 RepID=UPI0006153EF2|nr:TonB-dependent receptor [Aquincola tertiaricarbonis]
MPSLQSAASPLPHLPVWLLLAVLGGPLGAQVTQAQQPEQAQPEAAQAPSRITITGQRQPVAPAAAEPQTTLSGAGLRNRQAATLGATLEQEMGVGNASFGPNVGLPVVRGQGGTRTRVMQGGLGTHDASSVSADHGVMVEPALAERIVVHRGPAAVRFGGNAIGGAVEVDEQRIPMRRPAQARGRGESRLGTDGGMAMLRLDGPAADTLAWHVDVHGRRSPRTRIAGWALDEDAIREQFQLVNGRNSHGRIDNSDARSEGGAVALSRVTGSGALGLSVSRLQQHYGLPPGAHSHASGTIGVAPPPEEVRIAATQRRLDLQGEFDLEAPHFPQLRVRAARVDYSHDETDQGRLGSRFSNQVSEGRIELDHAPARHLSGTWGLQLQHRVFSALGPEAFVPRTQVRSLGLFAIERLEHGPWRLEGGLRVEHQESRPPDSFPVPALGGDVPLQTRRFTPGSGSLALQRAYGGAAQPGGADDTAALPGGRVTLTHWRASRAPDVQELYAGGPHIATRSFDLGNTGLDIEKLIGWDLGWQHAHGRFSASANAWRYRSDSYIYQRSLGWFYRPEEGKATLLCVRLDHCLPATKYQQAPAELHGYELELGWQLPLPTLGDPRLSFFSDAVRARLKPGGDVPRMPPQRYGLALQVAQGAWLADLRATRARAQARPGDNETATDGWFQLNASLRWTHTLDDARTLTWFVVGRNLGNQEVRNSASFIRNYAPEPGRTLQAGLEMTL